MSRDLVNFLRFTRRRRSARAVSNLSFHFAFNLRLNGFVLHRASGFICRNFVVHKNSCWTGNPACLSFPKVNSNWGQKERGFQSLTKDAL